jgi:hypothetical protein
MIKMETSQEQLNSLSDIKRLMERSSRFMSLSGLSGISAGIIALAGAAYAFFVIGYNQHFLSKEIIYGQGPSRCTDIAILLIDGLITLFLAVAFGIYFTTRRTKKKDLPIWDSTIRRFLINISVPLVTGGLFCLVLVSRGLIYLIAPVTLIFYGLALYNASKFTLTEIKYLGIIQISLGLIGCIWVGYGLILWAIGFGVLHIIYGSMMYFKYER